MYEPNSMEVALVRKWESWNNGQLLAKAKTKEEKFYLALQLERKAETLLKECSGNRAIFIPQFETMLAEMAQNGEI